MLQPSADQIAARAGVSRRSIFNHFRDLTALYDAVTEAGMRRCAPLLEEIPRSAPVDARVAKLAEVCARFLEATTPYRRALSAQALAGPATGQALRVARTLLRRQRDEVAALFEGELAALPAPERSELVEALAAAVSPSSWEHLRTSRGLSPQRARGVVARTLAALLRDAGVS